MISIKNSDAKKVCQVDPQGRRKEAQALIIKYGAERLSEISPEHYASLLAEAEAL